MTRRLYNGETRVYWGAERDRGVPREIAYTFVEVQGRVAEGKNTSRALVVEMMHKAFNLPVADEQAQKRFEEIEDGDG
jgi:hypothetical protein